jgi:glycogen debranching enzyme
MTSSPTSQRSLQRLLALDLAALGSPEERDWRRLGDRLAANRPSIVLVYIGAETFPGMPMPDYVVDDAGASIIRFPGGDPVSEWPTPAGPAGIASALAHLADGLLVPWSKVCCVLGADRKVPEHLECVILLGEQGPDDRWTVAPDEDGVIAALEEQQFFGRTTAVVAPDICDTAFERARDTLARNITSLGFTAASTVDNALGDQDANYAAIWARDGIITGLWTLFLEDPELVEAFRATIRVLARHQAPSGQIPANVQLDGEVPSYSGIGGIASIDSVLWFVIGAVRLAFHSHDRAFAEEMREPIGRAMSWLAAHDANNDALIEIPESSDWMDIFPRSYNVLYDEVLWWQACLHTRALLDELGEDGSGWEREASSIRSAVLDQFWPSGEQLMQIAGAKSGRFSPGEAFYLLSQITPFDYGWRCDVYGNLMAALTGLLDERKLDRLFTFLWGVGVNSPFPVACLYPPVNSGAEDWKDYFLVNFLNIPDHYQNGGIWPYIGGLWVRFLAAIGRVELAHRELAALAEACRLGVHGEWEFNEWLHGRTGRPMGKAHQAWSAASYAHAYAVLYGSADPHVFPPLEAGALAAKPRS